MAGDDLRPLQADHVWVAPPLTRGPRKGQPSSQRQCTECGIWETELSRARRCPGEPFDDKEA